MNVAPNATPAPLVETRGLAKHYVLGGETVHALEDVTLQLRRAEFVAVTGPTGAGKSTLLHLLGCLARPSRGSYRLRGEAIERLDDEQLAEVRNRRIGLVFQAFNLLETASAWENVALPLRYAGVRGERRRRRAMEALALVGAAELSARRPGQLSGGQQQRVAIARAIVNEPDLLLADEPTGSLDRRSASGVLALFDSLNARGMTVVMVTHDELAVAHARRTIVLDRGRLATHLLGAPVPSPSNEVRAWWASHDGNETCLARVTGY